MDSLLRMEKILALIEANPQGISGRELAQACNVPWTVMQKDLNAISLATENPIPLYTDADDVGDDEDQALSPETKWYMETSGQRNSPLHLTVGETLQILDGLDFMEQKHAKKVSLKQKITAALDLSQEGNYRYIKGNMTPVERMDEEILRTVEQAIRYRRKVSFEFNSGLVVAAPLGLVYYSRLRQWYLAVNSDDTVKTYNLARIANVKEEQAPFVYPEGFSLRDWLAPQWGMEFGEPFQVKVRFTNRAQTFAKVRKDVAHRQCRLTEEDGGKSLIYEDTVIGRNEFIAWLLGFGSAAEVLEPEELRQEILLRIKETLARYR